MCLSYKKVCQTIDNLLKRQANAMCDKIRYFIEDYKEMVERNIMGSMDNEILGLCLKIYDKHKEAIETIKRAVEKKYYERISNVLQEIINENSSLVLETCGGQWVRFISKRVADYASLQIAEEDWVKSNKILMVEIRIERRNIFADIIIRQPKDDNAEKQKNKLLNLAKEEFKYTKQKGYAHIYSVPLFNEENEYFESLCKSDSELKETLKKKLEKSKIIETYEDFAHKANELLTKG